MSVKGFFLRLFFALCFFAVLPSCASKGELEQLEQKVNELARQIDGGGYVLAVVPDEDGGGYTLTFDDGRTVHISLSVKSGDNSSQTTGKGVTFRSVDTSNPDYVVITLSDGTVLRIPTWTAFSALQQQVKQLNINLSALSRIISAIQENDFLVSTSPFIEDGVQVGWLLNFSKSGLVVIYSSLGYTTKIGVKRDTDGVYYWTVGDQWLLSPDGEKVRAEGTNGADAVAPKLKIEDGYWWISYDNEATWTKLGKATGDDGDSFFSEVDVSNEEYVRLVLADGSVLIVPKYVPIGLVLDVPQEGLVIPGGFTKIIPYTITGTSRNNVYVSVLVNGDISASISTGGGNTGKVSITMPKDSEGGTVTVMASTESGASIVKLINCEPLRFTAWGPDNEPRAIPIMSHRDFFNVDTGGGTITLRYKSNTPFKANITKSTVDGSGPSDWLYITHFDGGLEGTIEMRFGANDSDVNRFADVKLNFSDEYLKDNHYSCSITVTICQPSEAFRMETSVVRAFADAFRQYEVSISCSLDPLTVKEREEYDWLQANIWHSSYEECILNVAVDSNPSTSERTGIIDVLSPKGVVLGSLTVVQEALSVSNADCMVLRVLASAANDFSVYLPLMGEMDCYVDWGDGRGRSITTQIEGGVNNLSFYHRYFCSEPTEYTVRVKGKVSKMSTPASMSGYVTIISVDRWGKLGLTSMDHAFYKVATLKSIAADPIGSFAGVTTFESAFEGCTGLESVPVSLFDNALQVNSFKRCFHGVSGLERESPYTVVEGQKVHLYERRGYSIFAPITDSRFCFRNGHWADQEAIHLAGWD